MPILLPLHPFIIDGDGIVKRTTFLPHLQMKRTSLVDVFRTIDTDSGDPPFVANKAIEVLEMR